MKRLTLACLAVLLLLATVPATAQRYAARRDGDIVQLIDAGTDTRVSIAPSIGNIAFRMTVKGHDVLRWPHADMTAFKTNPNQTGIPFMGPWIDSQLPIPNFQATPNFQIPTKIAGTIGSWELGVAWKLGVGSWELGVYESS